MKAYDAWVFFCICFGCRASGEKQAFEWNVYCGGGAFTINTLITKAAVPAAFSAEKTENTSHTEPLRALQLYENL